MNNGARVYGSRRLPLLRRLFWLDCLDAEGVLRTLDEERALRELEDDRVFWEAERVLLEGAGAEDRLIVRAGSVLRTGGAERCLLGA